MSKPAKVIFTISLILNVLFGGFVAGRMYRQVNESRPWDETKDSLAPETHKVLKTTFKGKMREIIPLFKDAHEKKKAMVVIISAPEFDGQAYDKLAAELGDLNDKLMEHRLMTIKTIFEQLPQEERAKMAQHTVEKMMGNPPPGKHRSEHGDFDSQRSEKHGAIEAAPGEEVFDTRESE